MDQVDNTLRLMALVLASVFGMSWLALGLVIRTNLKYASHFFSANLVLGIGVALVAQRSVETNFLTIQIPDWLIIGGISIFWSGILLLIKAKPPSVMVRVLPILIEFALTVTLPSDASSYYPRAVAFNTVASITSLLTFWSCISGEREERVNRTVQGFIAVPFLFSSLVFGFRAAQVTFNWIQNGPARVEIYHNYAPFLWVLIVVLILINISNTGMVVAKLVSQLNALANRDALTGCLNRRAITERLQSYVMRYKRYETPFSCVMFDIDHFKNVNDQYGHEAGDFALVSVTAKAMKNLRSLDELGRHGGEEFILLMPDSRIDAAQEVAERMRLSLEKSPFLFNGTSIPVTASFGVAELRPDESGESLMRRVDMAMYAAKQGGRNRVVLASQKD